MRHLLPLLVFAALALLGCTDRRIELTDTPSFEITELETGAGARAEPGDRVTAQYTVSLPDGTTVVDVTGSKSHSWTLGDLTVIVGVDEAVVGMRPGGRRLVRIPPDLHYGPEGYGDGVIPPNTVLVAEITLVSVR